MHPHAEEGHDHHHDEANEPAAAPIDESKPHTHAPGTSPHAPATAPADQAAAPEMMTHRHADGTVESHPVESQDAHEATDEHHH